MPSHKPKSIPNPRKHFSRENLCYIYKKFPEQSHKAAGIDGITPKKFKDNFDVNITNISKILSNKEFKFHPLKGISIEKGNGKKRIICIPTVRDRLVQRLILDLLTHPKDKLGVKNKISFGVLKGEDSGYHQAIKCALNFRAKHNWVLKTDISAFFDNIDRNHLLGIVKTKIKDFSLFSLIQQVINCEIQFQNQYTNSIIEEAGIISGKGLRQGMPLSPLLSNLFLKKFDNLVTKKSLNIVRYLDDIIVFCDPKEECYQQKELIEKALNKVKLNIPSLKEINGKTEIIEPNNPVVFLGVEIYRSNSDTYLTKIPQRKIEAALSELDPYEDYQYCLSENHTYFSLTRLLKNKETGYKSSYRDTTNLENFLLKLEEKKGKIKNKLLTDILGIEIFNFLREDQRRFLCID